MSDPRQKSRRATAIGAYLPKVAAAAFERHGFPSADLLAEWPEIIGAEFAAISAPERLVWPRGAEPEPGDARAPVGFKNARRVAATLVLRVDGPRAVEIQHVAPQLLERINVYFGYRAISELRLVQGPVKRRRKREQEPPQRADTPAQLDADIEDDGLRTALAKLGATVK